MKRVDRVLDLWELLRGREATTVGALARTLRVSRRTVLRDLAALRDRGVPLVTEAGPGGGVFLPRDAGVAAVHLGMEELVGLWVAARLSTVDGALPWSGAAKAALQKVLASLPAERARSLRALVKRIVVGRPATPAVLATLGRPTPELLTAFERAFTAGVCLAFDYVDRRGNATQREVEPHGLLVEHPAWYLLTRDTKNGEPRMFRMDRIQHPRVLTKRPFVQDFDGLARDHAARR